MTVTVASGLTAAANPTGMPGQQPSRARASTPLLTLPRSYGKQAMQHILPVEAPVGFDPSRMPWRSAWTTSSLGDSHGHGKTTTPRRNPFAPLALSTKMEAQMSPDTPAPQKDKDMPERIHTLQHHSSVLALAVSDDYVFAGTHLGEIVVWSLESYELVRRIQAHKRSVLCLFLSTSDCRSLLFSSAGDALISVWCPKTLGRLYEIYSTYDVGDIFSVAYSVQRDTVYLGAQNTTIQWVRLSSSARRVTHDSCRHPDRRQHRFFDSKAAWGTSTPRRNDQKWSLIPNANDVLEISVCAIRQFAHFGYVYCMLIAKGPSIHVDPNEEVLISGGGDGTIKLWRLCELDQDDGCRNPDSPAIQELMCLGTDDAESVMSLAIDGSFLYAGKLEGVIELWDLDTQQKLRVIKSREGDVMSLQMGWGSLWSSSAHGFASHYSTVHNYSATTTTNSSGGGSGHEANVSQKYQCLQRWKAHDGKILASAVTTHRGHRLFISGANDNVAYMWRVNSQAGPACEVVDDAEDVMFTTLREFVSFKTVSSMPEYAEDCRRGASFLGALFKRLGGEVEVLNSNSSSGGQPHNPVVCARFSGRAVEAKQAKKRLLFYGHYDVVPADVGRGWHADPFQVTGMDGYLYGRGVTDNKGPILAALYAVTDLMQAKSLACDIIFVIEGEEESGSRGFQETIRQNKDWIGHVDYVLLANSYWLDDEVPCLTYGLRGVLHATVSVDSDRPDLHSGVDGSCLVSEPLSDLTLLLSTVKGRHNRILIPYFYDGILPLTPDEEARYDDTAALLTTRHPEMGSAAALKHSLMARSREPNFTIHRYHVSGPAGSLVSGHASAHISFRLVPGQEVADMIDKLTRFLHDQFALMDCHNRLRIQIDNQAEPWLGDPDNGIFRTLERAVMQVWGAELAKCTVATGEGGESVCRKPLYIREGGSIPAIRFLEKEFGAPAAHLPCGQASDSAHLVNERMRITSLVKSRQIFGLILRDLARP